MVEGVEAEEIPLFQFLLYLNKVASCKLQLTYVPENHSVLMPVFIILIMVCIDACIFVILIMVCIDACTHHTYNGVY